MGDWMVRIAGMSDGALYDEDTVDAVIDAIARYAGVVSYRADRIAVRMTVPAPDAQQALATGVDVLNDLGLHLIPIEIIAANADAETQPDPHAIRVEWEREAEAGSSRSSSRATG